MTVSPDNSDIRQIGDPICVLQEIHRGVLGKNDCVQRQGALDKRIQAVQWVCQGGGEILLPFICVQNPREARGAEHACAWRALPDGDVTEAFLLGRPERTRGNS